VERTTMKIVFWNLSKENQPVSGFHRYEEELFQTIKKIYPLSDTHRIQRIHSRVIGNTLFSWLYRYTSQNADIVHATFQTLAPIAFFRRPKKFILTVLDMTPMVYPETITNISTKIQWILTPKALKLPDKIITISEFTKKEVIRLGDVDASKIEVIYLGVDHSRYYPMNRALCKRKLGLGIDEKHILVVSSNSPHKRMDIAKAVFERIKREYPNVKLLKVGYGEILEGEGIINLGWVKEEDMPYLYNAADIFLHTAEYEGFGLPVLEAMACGTPVVVSSCASLPEVVGDGGYLIDLLNPEYLKSFSNTILQIFKEGSMKDSVERSKLFTWEKTALDTYKLYERVLNSGKS
jgi:glycosyltransferase involved in cell wall biosynthesis